MWLHIVVVVNYICVGHIAIFFHCQIKYFFLNWHNSIFYMLTDSPLLCAILIFLIFLLFIRFEIKKDITRRGYRGATKLFWGMEVTNNLHKGIQVNDT